MKWLWTLLAVTLLQLTESRGLKAPRAPDEGVVFTKQLQVENQALERQNKHLKAMMQMARAEVHRMDVNAAVGAGKAHHRSCAESDVLKQEILDLKQKLKASEADKTEMVQSLRQMMARNATQIFQKQAERAQELEARAKETEMALELKCGQERQAFDAQLKEVNGKCDDSKELAQSLQDDNVDLQKKLRAMQTKLASTMQTNKEVAGDKVNLLLTLQSLMRESSKFKHGLQKETDIEQREAKELLADKAKLAAMSIKMAAKPAMKKPARRILKAFHGNRTSEAAQRAHLRAINKYIDGAEMTDEEVDDASEEQMSAMQRQEDLFKKGKVGAHLSDWLGLKAASTAKVATADKTQLQKPKPIAEDGGESEAEALLNEAKSQLAAMNAADAESSDP